jgi:hypothetical protein
MSAKLCSYHFDTAYLVNIDIYSLNGALLAARAENKNWPKCKQISNIKQFWQHSL